MSVRKQPGRGVAFSVYCDAVDCKEEFLIIADRLQGNDVVAITGIWWSDGELYWRCCDVLDAVDYAVDQGWQEGTTGIQRGHIYCPKHKEES
ncbi:hypothetical protein [Bifidobacterium olomucense]|uniref:Uncharacterized protein n=1 Tax=Bifidobacterium olomucense TaxID=2675324 RepID=A0A7Y0EXB5_9BIFI|nr:hypothetical protein [Bifidobacterium sp. DSM 109959]NMM98107.1 hypothetical protein [Bifidobacterium sp. DSM 109959]